jgi:hypothetical protein
MIKISDKMWNDTTPAISANFFPQEMSDGFTIDTAYNTDCVRLNPAEALRLRDHLNLFLDNLPSNPPKT